MQFCNVTILKYYIKLNGRFAQDGQATAGCKKPKIDRIGVQW